MTRYKEHTTVEITINEKDRKHIGEEMKRFLADTYVLYVMSQNFHWNVTGPLFHSLHLLFEKQYLELAEAADLIAERIRALGLFTPGTLRDFTELSSLHEDAQIPEAEEMIQRLIEGHLLAAQKASYIAAMSTEAQDLSTADLLADRIMAHEKAIWMLRSILV